MADAVERLLSLGWPGQDEYFRQEAANQVDSLAKTLREDGKAKEAEELQAKLAVSLARDVFVRLSWDGDADFDLLVDEPLGATACYQTPRPPCSAARSSKTAITIIPKKCTSAPVDSMATIRFASR